MTLRDLEITREIKHGGVKQPLFRHLDTVGDGSGSNNAVLDYSSSEARFKILPPAGNIIRITTMVVSISDTTGMQAEEYGNLGSALTNGIAIAVVRAGITVNDITDGVPVKTNAEWGHVTYEVSRKTWGAGDEMILARWDFRDSGSVIRLIGDKNESLDVILNDNFTGLIGHHFFVSGYYE